MPPALEGQPKLNLFGSLGFVQRHGFLLVLASIYVFFSFAAPSFFGLGNFIGIVNVVAPVLVVSAGMALIVIAGKLDISVGSIAYVASAIVAIGTRDMGLSLATVVLLAVLAGLIMGAINAIIVVHFKVNALIATLGTMISFRGFGLWLTDGGLINLPAEVRQLGNSNLTIPLPGVGELGPIYVTTIVALVLLLCVHILHQGTNFGRQITAIGNNDETARRLGIPVGRRMFAAFLISGVLGAIGGIIFTMQVGVNTAKIGEGMEFIAVAVVVVGGVSLFGGRGHILKAVLLGALAFQMIRSGLQHSDASPYSFRLVEGIVIFVAMYFDALKRD